MFGPLETLIGFLRENQGVVFPVLNLVGFNLSMSFLSPEQAITMIQMSENVHPPPPSSEMQPLAVHKGW